MSLFCPTLVMYSTTGNVECMIAFIQALAILVIECYRTGSGFKMHKLPKDLGF